jgi:hypothetical protein
MGRLAHIGSILSGCRGLLVEAPTLWSDAPHRDADMEMPPVDNAGDGPGAPANDDAGPNGAEAGAAGGDPLPPSQVEKEFFYQF